VRAIALFVSAWLGAAILLAASVAPAAFAVLPSRTLAGDLVGRILPPLLVTGFILGVLAACFRARVAGSIMAISCLLGFGMGRWIDRVRATIPGPVDALPETDPRRVAFGRLHGASVALLGVAMLAALTMIFVVWRSYDSR
jgi:lipoprotein signal peptidase